MKISVVERAIVHNDVKSTRARVNSLSQQVSGDRTPAARATTSRGQVVELITYTHQTHYRPRWQQLKRRSQLHTVRAGIFREIHIAAFCEN